MYIGSTNIVNSPFKVWTDNRTDVELRQSERLLFSRVHLITAYLNNMPADDPQRNVLLNMLSVYYIELQLIKEFGVTPDYLYRAGVVLSRYVSEIMGRTFLSDEERNAFILNVLSDIKQRTINGTTSVADMDFFADWLKDVYDQNYFIDFTNGGISQNTPSANIGDVIDTELTNGFIKVAGNLVYTVVPYSTMSTNEAKRKRALQNAVISSVCGSGFGFTDAICTNYINSAIVNSTHGLSPEIYVEGMKEAGKEMSAGIGIAEEVVALIVGIVTSFLTAGTAVFTAIYNARKNTAYRDAVSGLNNAEMCYADIPDWLKLGDIDGDGTDDTLKVWLGMLGIGTFAYLYSKKR